MWALQKWLNWSRCCFGYGFGWAQRTRCGGGPKPPGKGAILGDMSRLTEKYRDTLPQAVQQQLNTTFSPTEIYCNIHALFIRRHTFALMRNEWFKTVCFYVTSPLSRMCRWPSMSLYLLHTEFSWLSFKKISTKSSSIDLQNCKNMHICIACKTVQLQPPQQKTHAHYHVAMSKKWSLKAAKFKSQLDHANFFCSGEPSLCYFDNLLHNYRKLFASSKELNYSICILVTYTTSLFTSLLLFSASTSQEITWTQTLLTNTTRHIAVTVKLA